MGTKYKYKWLILIIIVGCIVCAFIIPDPPQCIAYSYSAIKLLVVAQVTLGLVYLALNNILKTPEEINTTNRYQL